jgi:hypothetical protein
MNINLKHLYLLYTTFLSKILLFLKNILKIKSPSANAKGLGIFWLPGQDDYRTFCMSDETEKVYQKLEKVTELLN